MAKLQLNLRDSQLQARLGLVSAIGSAAFTLILAFVVLENFNPSEKTIGYSPQSLRWPAVLGLTGLSAFTGAVAFGLGFSSLGHKRNARQRESWLGLLVGALTVSLTIILYVVFRMFSLPVVT